jgi:carbon monoxide dehydrogenase subunit G
MPQRETRFSVAATPAALWAFIRDFELLCGCIPGVERIALVDACTVSLRVREKLGVVPLIVELTACVEEESPPFWLRAVARADHLRMHIDVRLSALDDPPQEPAAAERTELVTLFDVIGEGPLKPVVDRLFERRASERAAQFAATLEQRFGTSAGEGPDAPPAAKPP